MIIERNPMTSWHWLALFSIGFVLYLGVLYVSGLISDALYAYHGFPTISILLVGIFNVSLITFGIFLLLKPFHLKMKDIGFTKKSICFDILLGVIIGISWAILILFVFLPSVGITEGDIVISGFIINSLPKLIAAIVSGWLIGGFVEEMVFRGYLMSTIGQLFSSRVLEILITSILSIFLFMLLHLFTGVVNMLDLALFATITCILFHWRKSLIAPIIAHGLTDMLLLLGFYMLY